MSSLRQNNSNKKSTEKKINKEKNINIKNITKKELLVNTESLNVKTEYIGKKTILNFFIDGERIGFIDFIEEGENMYLYYIEIKQKFSGKGFGELALNYLIKNSYKKNIIIIDALYDVIDFYDKVLNRMKKRGEIKEYTKKKPSNIKFDDGLSFDIYIKK